MEKSTFSLFCNLMAAACGRLIRNRERSLTLTLCLAVILFPLLTALAVSEGLRYQAEISLLHGADLYLNRDYYGGSGPIAETDLRLLKQSALGDRLQVQGRVLGRTYFVNRLVAVVGLDRPPDGLSPLLQAGRIFKNPGEVVIGRRLAQRFNLQPGVKFALTANPGKLFTLVGLLTPLAIWDSDLMVMSLSDAQAFFGMKGRLSEIQIRTSDSVSRGSGENLLVEKVRSELPGSLPLRSTTRTEAGQLLNKGFGFQGGIYLVFYILAAVLAVPALLVSSGLGTPATAREIGLMRALGWTRKQILALTALEYILLSLSATALATLVSMAWMKGTNGFLLAQFLIAEVELVPGFDVPTRYLPFWSLTGLCLAFVTTLGGSLFYTWHCSRKTPYESMP
jgi:ABC-type lipoprotein release transport system permease subunit